MRSQVASIVVILGLIGTTVAESPMETQAGKPPTFDVRYRAYLAFSQSSTKEAGKEVVALTYPRSAAWSRAVDHLITGDVGVNPGGAPPVDVTSCHRVGEASDYEVWMIQLKTSAGDQTALCVSRGISGLGPLVVDERLLTLKIESGAHVFSRDREVMAKVSSAYLKLLATNGADGSRGADDVLLSGSPLCGRSLIRSSRAPGRNASAEPRTITFPLDIVGGDSSALFVLVGAVVSSTGEDGAETTEGWRSIVIAVLDVDGIWKLWDAISLPQENAA